MKNKKASSIQIIFTAVMKYFRIIVIAGLVLIACSGVFRVNSNEAAVVLRFGKLVGESHQDQVLQPGLHFAFPYIVDEVIVVPVGKVQERTITTHCGNGAAISPNIMVNGYIITGDSNIVLMKSKVKYTVSDVVRFALFQDDVGRTIDGLVSGEVTALVSSLGVDTILTSGRAKLYENVRENAQKRLDELDCGLVISSIEFTEVIPPAETKSQFDYVNTAAVKKETMIQKATEEASVVLLEAQAQAKTLVQDARSDGSLRMSKAYKEVAEFDGLVKQYQANPASVYDGVFRLRVSQVLSKMGTSVIVPEGGQDPVVILP